MRERFNDLADQATEGYNVARRSASRGMRSAYHTAQEYAAPIAAVVVGLGITAFLLWAAQRAGGWRRLQDNTKDRMREGYDYVRERASRIRSEAPQLGE